MGTPKPDERYYDAASLHLKDGLSWKASCIKAGFNPIKLPAIDGKFAARALSDVGVEIELEGGEPQVTQQEVQDIQDEDDPDLRALVELSVLEDAPWEDILPRAKAVLVKIMAGKIDAPPGRVAAVKEAIARAEGRVGQTSKTEDDKLPIGVIILPMQLDHDSIEDLYMKEDRGPVNHQVEAPIEEDGTAEFLFEFDT